MQQSPMMDSDASQVLLGMAYDTTYDLHDHYSPSSVNPLDTVAMHPAEDYKHFSGLYRSLERYERYGIKDNFGLTLLDYLSLPRDVIDMLVDLTKEISDRREAIENNAEAGAKHDVRSNALWKHIR